MNATRSFFSSALRRSCWTRLKYSTVSSRVRQRAVVKVGRGVLDPPEREGLDGAVMGHHHPVHQLQLVEALGLQVVHAVVGVVRARVTRRASGLAVEERLALEFGGRGHGGIQLPIDVQLGGRRKIEDRQELRHEVDLGAALQDVDALLGGHAHVAVEVGGPLLELREVLDRLQRALRPEEALDVHAAQRRSVDAVTELLGPDVPDEVGGVVGVTVDVAVEASHAEHTVSTVGPSVLGGVELLLGELREQEPEPLQLLRVEDAVEDLVEIVDRDEAALGHVAQIRAGGEVDGRRGIRQDMLGQVEVHIEPGEPRQELQRHLREEHASLGVVGERQRLVREVPLILDLRRSHLIELFPAAVSELGRRPHRDRLAAGHLDTRIGFRCKVVPRAKQVCVGFGPLRLDGQARGLDLLERLRLVDRSIARRDPSLLSRRRDGHCHHEQGHERARQNDHAALP